MRKLKTFVAVLMLVFVLGIAVPQAFADGGETQGPSLTDPGDGHGPGMPGEINTPGITQGPGITDTPPDPGDVQDPGFASWAKIIFQILGNGWNV